MNKFLFLELISNVFQHKKKNLISLILCTACLRNHGWLKHLDFVPRFRTFKPLLTFWRSVYFEMSFGVFISIKKSTNWYNIAPLSFLFDLILEARAEILPTISLVFWYNWRHQKDISKLTDLYYAAKSQKVLSLERQFRIFWVSKQLYIDRVTN